MPSAGEHGQLVIMAPKQKHPVYRSERSLVCLIQALQGKNLVVELRNDVVIRGKLDDVDDFMNLTFSDVTQQTMQGRNIRFVHLPRSLDPAQAIDAQRRRIIKAKLQDLKERLSNLLPRLAKGHEGGSAEDPQMDAMASSINERQSLSPNDSDSDSD